MLSKPSTSVWCPCRFIHAGLCIWGLQILGRSPHMNTLHWQLYVTGTDRAEHSNDESRQLCICLHSSGLLHEYKSPNCTPLPILKHCPDSLTGSVLYLPESPPCPFLLPPTAHLHTGSPSHYKTALRSHHPCQVDPRATVRSGGRLSQLLFGV